MERTSSEVMMIVDISIPVENGTWYSMPPSSRIQRTTGASTISMTPRNVDAFQTVLSGSSTFRGLSSVRVVRPTCQQLPDQLDRVARSWLTSTGKKKTTIHGSSSTEPFQESQAVNGRIAPHDTPNQGLLRHDDRWRILLASVVPLDSHCRVTRQYAELGC